MERIVVVTKPTRLEELVQQHMTRGAARFYLESQGQSISLYEQEDRAYYAALDTIRKQIPGDIAQAHVTREYLPNFMFRENDLVIVCGPDGLFVNTAQYLSNQPVLCINPDPSRVAGVLMLFQPHQVRAVIIQVLAGKASTQALPFVKGSVDDAQTIWGINDVFIGRKDHASARYSISHRGRTERHSSSGLIVSTGIGGTGWMKSIQTMITAITGSAGSIRNLPDVASPELVFVVREPFPSPTTTTSLVTGRVQPNQPLTVVSEMPEGGCMFSDGIVEKALTWNAGSIITVTVGERYVQRIIP